MASYLPTLVDGFKGTIETRLSKNTQKGDSLVSWTFRLTNYLEPIEFEIQDFW